MTVQRELLRMEVQGMERDVALSAFNAVLGAWLIASSFLWRHSTASLVNQLAIGVVCVAVALLSARVPAARWIYVPLAAWTAASPYIIPLRDTTGAVTLVAAAIVMLLSPITMRWLGQDDPREVVRHTDEI